MENGPHFGYEVDRVLSTSDVAVCYACRKGGDRYVLKDVRLGRAGEDVARTLPAIRHRNAAKVVEVLAGGGGDRVTVVTEWCESLGAEEPEKIILEEGPPLVRKVFEVSRYIRDLCGMATDEGLNIKLTNISFSRDRDILLHDWYIPYVTGTPSTYSVAADRNGLASWLQSAMSGGNPFVFPRCPDKVPLPPFHSAFKSASVVDNEEVKCAGTGDAAGYLRFLEKLVESSEEVESDAWLAVKNPRRLQRSSAYDIKRKHVDATRFVTSLHEAHLFLTESLHKSLYHPFRTDRYIDPRDEAQIKRAATTSTPTHRFDAHDVDACISAWKSREADASPPADEAPGAALQTRVGGRTLESVWWSEEGVYGCNEDSLVVVPDLSLLYDDAGSRRPELYYACAVLDGHGGSECAEYCAHQLLPAVFEHSGFPDDMAAAFEGAFAAVHDRFSVVADALHVDSGTTATVAIIHGDVAHIANIGDSSVVVAKRSGEAKLLTVDHRADVESEQQLVALRGGCVLNVMGAQRVQGLVTVTRSIGDRPVRKYLSRSPNVAAYPIAEDDCFLIIATDGLWDYVTHDEAAQYALETKAEIDSCAAERDHVPPSSDSSGHAPNGDTPRSVSSMSSSRALCDDYQAIAEALVLLAKDKGSTDDATVCVVLLNGTANGPPFG
ncbi:putative protein phosphatase 2C 59 [Diplonema papillatum]|nr:putative protein phosphatase 2C 59 [Diplonema papillatum]